MFEKKISKKMHITILQPKTRAVGVSQAVVESNIKDNERGIRKRLEIFAYRILKQAY